MSELAAFKDRDIIPSLFIENKPLDTKNYLLVKVNINKFRPNNNFY
jgi:hypothetical protein